MIPPPGGPPSGHVAFAPVHVAPLHWHKCAPLDQNQRRAIGLTKRDKKTGLLAMPGYGAINDIVNRIDPIELARALNAWLSENSDLLPKSLALDGKSIGAKGRLGGIVTLCFHATGQPLAHRPLTENDSPPHPSGQTSRLPKIQHMTSAPGSRNGTSGDEPNGAIHD